MKAIILVSTLLYPKLFKLDDNAVFYANCSVMVSRYFDIPRSIVSDVLESPERFINYELL